jgi:hypothetical protein
LHNDYPKAVSPTQNWVVAQFGSFAHCDYFAAFAVRILVALPRSTPREAAKIAKKARLPSKVHHYPELIRVETKFRGALESILLIMSGRSAAW